VNNCDVHHLSGITAAFTPCIISSKVLWRKGVALHHITVTKLRGSALLPVTAFQHKLTQVQSLHKVCGELHFMMELGLF